MSFEKPASIESLPQPTVELFNPTLLAWDEVREDVLELEKKCFGEKAFSESSLEAIFENPENVAVLLNKEKKIIGFTLGVPSRKVSDEIHIHSSEIDPEEQGKGYIRSILELFDHEARTRGYSFITRDAAIDNGYADKISKNYIDSIVETYDHDSPHGRQRYFKIAL